MQKRHEGCTPGVTVARRSIRRCALNGSEPGRLAPRPQTHASALPDDATILAGLRARDMAVFARIVDAWTPLMLRLARGHVRSLDSAADIVREAWLAVLHGIDRFDGSLPLRTWALRTVSDIAKANRTRERRVGVRPLVGGGGLPSVPTHRFLEHAAEHSGSWRHPPHPWPDLRGPEGEIPRAEIRMTVAAAVRSLPARQRLVVTMRDIEGFSADEVCHLLDLSAANQRVILHRGRAAVLSLVENHFGRHVQRSALP